MTGPGQSGRAVRFGRRALPVLTAALLAAVPAAAQAKSGGKRHHNARHGSVDTSGGAVYTTTNDPSGNGVIVFSRNPDGTLTQGPTVPTGGTGLAAQPPFQFPIVDSSGSMALVNGGRLLFVVNDGDNTISSLRTTRHGLKLVDRVSSGGVLPISLTTHGNVLYVVNEVSSSIAGYTFTNNGRLSPIPGSAQLLSPLFPSGPGAPGGVAAQIGFSPDGSQLVVTERGLPGTSGTIDTFAVNPNGSLTLEQALTGAGVDPNPFGFAFTSSGQLLVSNVGRVKGPINYPAGNLPIPQIFDKKQFNGSASSYSLSSTGTLTPISTKIGSRGRGACWIVVSSDDRFAFVANTLSSRESVPQDIGTGINGVSRYTVGQDGSLSLLGTTNTDAGDPTDEVVSSDGQFLYVNVPTVTGPNDSHVDAFRINSDGSLTPVASQVGGLPATISGVAAS
jgi:6-phosphogluconolactonase (cycloisomerase 2 family)